MPVVHPVAARVWYVQKQLRVRQPVQGAGRLLKGAAVVPRRRNFNGRVLQGRELAEELESVQLVRSRFNVQGSRF